MSSLPSWPDTGLAGTLVAATLLLAFLRMLQWVRLWWHMPPGPWGLPLVRTFSGHIIVVLTNSSPNVLLNRRIQSVYHTLTSRIRGNYCPCHRHLPIVFFSFFINSFLNNRHFCISFFFRFLRFTSVSATYVPHLPVVTCKH